MFPATAPPDLPDVPLSVLEFAREQEIGDHLRPVLTLTRTIFPAAAIALRLEDDPEIAGYRVIAVDVDVRGWNVEDMVAGHNQWTELLLRVCQPDLALNFRIRMVQT